MTASKLKWLVCIFFVIEYLSVNKIQMSTENIHAFLKITSTFIRLILTTFAYVQNQSCCNHPKAVSSKMVEARRMITYLKRLAKLLVKLACLAYLISAMIMLTMLFIEMKQPCNSSSTSVTTTATPTREKLKSRLVHFTQFHFGDTRQGSDCLETFNLIIPNPLGVGNSF